MNIIILGAGIMQGPAIRTAKELGLTVIAADGNAEAPLRHETDKFIHIDLKDKEKLLETAKNTKNLAGVMTAGTDFSTSVAYITEKLGLPGIKYETALNATDKERMRQKFKNAGVPSPAFTVVQKNQEITTNIEYPVVVKPVDNMGGRGCKKANNKNELRTAVTEALEYSRSGRAIIEEYMEGEEFSIDAIIYKNKITICGLANRHIQYPPHFIETGHTIPATTNAEKDIINTFKAGIEALGIDNGAAKGDIKLTPKGPMIGEIAARLSGGYMSGWTYPYSSGVNPVKAAIQIATSQEPTDLTPTRNHTEQTQNIKNVKNIFLTTKPGSKVKFPENNVGKCGNIISAAPTREEAIEAAENAVRTILIRLEPNNTDTDNFLKEDTTYPPSAYKVDKSIIEKLEEIPETTSKPYNFSQFLESKYKDYAGRTPKESLEAVRKLTGLPDTALGRTFWKAMIRGGYQGATYIVDNL